jgi:hypothetical protein
MIASVRLATAVLGTLAVLAALRMDALLTATTLLIAGGQPILAALSAAGVV